MTDKQILPDSEKTDKWAENQALNIYRSSMNQTDIHDRISFCYSFYNGETNQSDYDYLRKSGDYEFPALVRHVPLMKTMFKNLISSEAKRPFRWKVYLTDKESIKKKNQAKTTQILTYLRIKAQERVNEIIKAQTMLEQYEQQIAQSENPDPNILMQIRQQREIIEKQSYIDLKELNDIDKNFSLEHNELGEILVQKALKNVFLKQNFAMKFNQGMEDKIISDMEIYFINNQLSFLDPKLEAIDPKHFYYSMDDVDWIKDCQWAMYEKLVSFNGLVDSMPNIDPLKLEQISNRAGGILTYNHSNFHSNTGYQTDGYGQNYYYSDDSLKGTQIKLSYVFWQTPRKLWFYSVIDERGKVVEKYALKASDIPDKASYEVRYINEVWESVIADGDIVLYSRKRPFQIYDSNFNNLGLPFAGMNKWGRRKVNSMVWETKDLQIMYNLVNYHKELWLALGGVKGFIMDKSQIPDDMTPEEWMYQRKMGVGWIETVKKNKRVQTSFNQFQHYDDTVSASIQYLLKILEHYEKLASYVTGVSQQKLGMFVPTDQVGTSEMSIEQSTLTTEILFIEHEVVKRHALAMYANNARVNWNVHGREDQYAEGNMRQHIFSITPGSLDSAEFDIYVVDGSKEEGQIRMLQQLVMQGRQQNTFDIPSSAKMMMLDNVTELEAMIDHFSAKAMELAQASAKQSQDFEQQKLELENQMKAMAEKQKEKIEMSRIEIERARLEFDIKKAMNELEFEKDKLNKEISIKDKDISSEREVELLYLDFEKKKAIYDAKVNELKIQLDAVNNAMKVLEKGKTKEKIKD